MILHPYITLRDYLPTIQNGQLNKQILDELNDGTFERNFCESWAIEKIQENLATKFDLEAELTPTLPFDFNKIYGAYDRVTLDFQEWEAKSWSQNDLVCTGGNAYICQTPNTDAVFNADNWILLGLQYAIYYIPYPKPLFSFEIQKQRGAFVNGYYYVGNEVFWSGHTYSCIKETIVPDNSSYIQNVYTTQVPTGNVFPDDARVGKQYWTDLGVYEVDAGTLPIQEPWIKGDNRSPSILQAVVDLSLWRLHNRISPQNIPKLREDNMRSVFHWMQKGKDGDIQLQLQNVQPENEFNFRGGSKTRKQNGY